MRYNKNYRRTLRYKIKMKFYRLTMQDVLHDVKFIGIIIIESIAALIGFLLLFVLPALFH